MTQVTKLVAGGSGSPLDALMDALAGPGQVETPRDAALRRQRERATKPAAPKPAQSPGKRFIDAFGQQGGVWFAEGRTFEQAKSLYLAALRSERDALKAEVARLADRLESRAALTGYRTTLGNGNEAKIAAGIRHAGG